MNSEAVWDDESGRWTAAARAGGGGAGAAAVWDDEREAWLNGPVGGPPPRADDSPAVKVGRASAHSRASNGRGLLRTPFGPTGRSLRPAELAPLGARELGRRASRRLRSRTPAVWDDENETWRLNARSARHPPPRDDDEKHAGKRL